MKKRGFLIYLILGIFFLPSFVFAQSYNRNASVGRSAVMNTSSVYYYTDWKLLDSNSLNVVPIPYSGGDYYHMGSEYSFPITLVGDTSFRGQVKIPVVANTIYNYQLMNGLGANDMKFGLHQNWGVYGNLPDVTVQNSVWECQTYPHLGIAHNYCNYVIDFTFHLSEPWTGAYNLNVAVLDTTGTRSAYYYSGYDSNGNAIEFPVASQNSGYPTLQPSLTMSSTGGSSGSGDNTDEILDGITEATDAINDTIQESYENLVKSQEVCVDRVSTTALSFDIVGRINGSGELVDTSSNFWRTTSNYYTKLTRITNTGTQALVVSEFDSDKNFIGNTTLNTDDSKSLTTSAFYKFSSGTSVSYSLYQYYCQNGNQAINDSINDLNNTLNDHDLSGIDFTFGDIDVISDTPVSDLLLLPLEIITKITESLGANCITWDLPFNLWGNSNYVLHLPCINPVDYFGSTVWALIDDLFCIFMIFNIFKMLLRFFESWTSLNDTFDDVIGGVR